MRCRHCGLPIYFEDVRGCWVHESMRSPGGWATCRFARWESTGTEQPDPGFNEDQAIPDLSAVVAELAAIDRWLSQVVPAMCGKLQKAL